MIMKLLNLNAMLRVLAVLLFVALLGLGGCVYSSTTGNVTEKKHQQKIGINNHATGTVIVNFPVKGSWETDSPVSQEPKNSASLDATGNFAPGAAQRAKEAGTLVDAVAHLVSDRQGRNASGESQKTAVKDHIISPPERKPDSGTIIETGTYWGRPNSNRPQWYFKKDKKEYPPIINLDVPGCFSGTIKHFPGKRYDRGGVIFKQSSEPTRHAVLLLPASCNGKKATIRYKVP